MAVLAAGHDLSRPAVSNRNRPDDLPPGQEGSAIRDMYPGRAAFDILDGKYDDKPENWFYMVQGSLSDQLANEAKDSKKKDK